MSGGEELEPRAPEDPSERLRRTARALQIAERRQDGRNRVGPKAERTRRRLIDSAWKLFCDKGYPNTTVSDIVEDAGVSIPAFYQYFGDRIDIVSVLVADIVNEMLEQGVDRWDPRSGRMGLRRLVHSYVEYYRQHRAFFRLWHTVIHLDDRMRNLYADFHWAYEHRIIGFTRQAVELGLMRSDVDPAAATRAMLLMLEQYCYEAFVFRPEETGDTDDKIADLLTTLWADALGLVESDERPRARGRSGA